jgi:hypothetical protein
MAQPLNRVNPSGISPGACNGCGGTISGTEHYLKIAPRTDGAGFMNGWKFHDNVDHIIQRITQEILTPGRDTQRADLRRLADEIKRSK